MSEIIFKVSAKLLHAALPFAAKNDIRYYLNGINIRQSGGDNSVVIEATNGHMMVLLNDTSGKALNDPASVILCRDVVAKLPKTGEVLVYDDGSVEAANIRYNKATIDGKFPIATKVIPPDNELRPGVTTSTWRRDYFREAWALFPKLYKWDSLQVFQHHKGDIDIGAILITNDVRDAIVIIMPMRGPSEMKRPDWCEMAGGAK